MCGKSRVLLLVREASRVTQELREDAAVREGEEREEGGEDGGDIEGLRAQRVSVGNAEIHEKVCLT